MGLIGRLTKYGLFAAIVILIAGFSELITNIDKYSQGNMGAMQVVSGAFKAGITNTFARVWDSFSTIIPNLQNQAIGSALINLWFIVLAFLIIYLPVYMAIDIVTGERPTPLWIAIIVSLIIMVAVTLIAHGMILPAEKAVENVSQSADGVINLLG